MPRTLSLNLRNEKNQLESLHPWTILFELDIAGAPAPFRLASYDQDIIFHGLTYLRFPVDVDALEDANNMALVHLRVTAANVDQQIQSLLENYWTPVPDPTWSVTLWQVDAVQPNEVPFEAGEVFSVLSVTTDLLTAVFDLVAEGVTLTTSLPKRRYVASAGFTAIPRRI